MSDVRITEQDIASLSEKLAAMIETLTPAEAAAFEDFESRITALVAAEGADVQGYDFSKLDIMGADAHRQSLVRQARGRHVQDAHTGGSENRATVWQSLIATVTGARAGTE